MADADIQLVVEGPEAKELAGELAGLILEQFEHRASPVPVADGGGAAPGKKIDPNTVALAAFVLSMPGYVLAAVDLVKRLKKKPKAEKFLEGANAAMDERPGSEISVRKPDGTLVRVRNVDADTLVDLFTEVLR